MLEKPDAGALVDQQPVPILENDTALEVSMKVADAAQQVLARSLPKLIAGSAAARALDLAQGSYFGRRRPEDGRIDWRAGARRIHDLVRAVAPPFPGAFTEVNGLQARGARNPRRAGSAASSRSRSLPVRRRRRLVRRLHRRAPPEDSKARDRRPADRTERRTRGLVEPTARAHVISHGRQPRGSS